MNVNIEEEIRTRFAELMHIESKVVDFDADLRDHYGIDSLNALRLASEVEVHFDIDIPEDALNELRTLRNIVQFCESAISEKP